MCDVNGPRRPPAKARDVGALCPLRNACRRNRPNAHLGHLTEGHMKVAAVALCIALIAPLAAAAQPAGRPREVRFSGPSAVQALCECLLDARRIAEAQGHIDFSAEVESAVGGSVDITARIWMGSPHAVGRIDFAGHSSINDTTLRRAMTIYERDRFDVTQLRRSLARINGLGV